MLLDFSENVIRELTVLATPITGKFTGGIFVATNCDKLSETVNAPHDLFFQDGTDARSGDWLFINRYEFGRAI